jgi:hypothetical protein
MTQVSYSWMIIPYSYKYSIVYGCDVFEDIISKFCDYNYGLFNKDMFEKGQEMPNSQNWYDLFIYWINDHDSILYIQKNGGMKKVKMTDIPFKRVSENKIEYSFKNLNEKE